METPTLKCPRTGRMLTPLSMDYWRLKKKINLLSSDSSDEESKKPKSESAKKNVFLTPRSLQNKQSLCETDDDSDNYPSLAERLSNDRKHPRKTPAQTLGESFQQAKIALPNPAKGNQAKTSDNDSDTPLAPRRPRAHRLPIESSSDEEEENYATPPSRLTDNEEQNLAKSFSTSTRILSSSSSETENHTESKQDETVLISSSSDDEEYLRPLNERVNRGNSIPKPSIKPKTITASEPKSRVLKEQNVMPPPLDPNPKTKPRLKPISQTPRRSESIDDLLEDLRDRKHEDDDYDESQVDLNNSVSEWEATNADYQSFLQSLDEDSVPLKLCHPEAVVFRRSKFNDIKDKLVIKLFDIYHRTVFQNRFDSEIPVTWNVRMAKTAGFCYYRKNSSGSKAARIELSPKVVDRTSRLRDTLLHEMCHAAAWLIHGYRDGHGTLFKFWGQRAKQLLNLAVTTCHTYVIETKYIYKCKGCPNEVRRHSKSLDTSRFMCSICKSRFELFVNNKANNKLTPVFEKKGSAFSIFVKDHYKNVKAVSPHLSHAEVMTALSDRWKKQKQQLA